MSRRIDDSHHPFKRKRTMGPGPKRHPRVAETGELVCHKGKNTKTHYVQVCKVQGTGTVRTYKLKKSTKKRYNKLYRAWRARQKAAPKGRRPGYRCRRTARATCR